MTQSRVYFIQSGRGGPIKVGVAADPRARLGQLQVGNPKRLRLLGSIPGDASIESAIHRELDGDRVGGEWFKATARVRSAVKRRLSDAARTRYLAERVAAEAAPPNPPGQLPGPVPTKADVDRARKRWALWDAQRSGGAA